MYDLLALKLKQSEIVKIIEIKIENVQTKDGKIQIIKQIVRNLKKTIIKKIQKRLVNNLMMQRIQVKIRTTGQKKQQKQKIILEPGKMKWKLKKWTCLLKPT